MIKNIIALYPGRFQPFGQHHAAAFKWLQKEFGAANTYIVTSNVVQPPKSPFSFKDKQDIIRQYGFDDRLVQVKNPYKSEEILSKLNPADTAVVFMVGAKDMKEDPRFKIGKTKAGSDSYFQDYKKNKTNLQGFDKHGYLIVAPHVNINIPGYGEMSGTTLRKVLGAKIPRSQKIQQFKNIFGWYDKKTADMIFDKLENMNESKIFSKDWWGESLELNEAVSFNDLKMKFKKFLEALKQESKESKEAFSLLAKAAMGKIVLSDAEKKQIGEQMKDILKSIGLTAIAVAPGGMIAALLLKVMKAEKYVTPSAFMKEDKKDKDDPCWKGYRQYGMKKKGNKEVPNCVPEQIEEGYMTPEQQAAHNQKIEKLRKFLRVNIGREFAYNFNEFPKTVFGVKMPMHESGRWLSAEDKIGYIGYRDRVRNLSNRNFKEYRDLYNTSVKRGREWHLDHKYSIFEGYKNNIPESIIAHPCNLDLIHHTINESKNINSSITLNELMYKIEIFDFKELLMCGGAGGHMAHPFNIDWVKTGKDLVTVFQQSVNYLKKGPAAVKIDGVNASIRLITLDGKKVFVMDRGSNKPLDVKGITKAELEDRFGAGHGMIKVGGQVLDIFNEAIPDITNDLKKLGLWTNPNLMFNIEYVAGSTNVLSYNKNFLAIHGLLEIQQVTPTKRATKEVTYSKAAMQSLLNNLATTANEYGYEVLGSIPTTLDGDPDLRGELNKKYTITRTASEKETKTLSQWLAKAKVPTTTIKTTDGKTISALSKEVLIKIADGIPLEEFVADPKNFQDAIDGYVIYLATMKLGDAVLDKLSSPLGPVKEHEGIVIRDKSISSKPFKITGKFILGGLASSFNK